jgi:hypothetical protein
MAISEREHSGKTGNRENFVPRHRRVLVSTGTCLVLLLSGIMLRHWTWNSTAPIRFAPDLTAAWHWGTQAMQVGYLNLYDVVVERVEDGNYILDYVPLRLLAVTAWVRVTSAMHPEVTWWQPRMGRQSMAASNTHNDGTPGGRRCVFSRTGLASAVR